MQQQIARGSFDETMQAPGATFPPLLAIGELQRIGANHYFAVPTLMSVSALANPAALAWR
jgi:hypothetical protein